MQNVTLNSWKLYKFLTNSAFDPIQTYINTSSILQYSLKFNTILLKVVRWKCHLPRFPFHANKNVLTLRSTSNYKQHIITTRDSLVLCRQLPKPKCRLAGWLHFTLFVSVCCSCPVDPKPSDSKWFLQFFSLRSEWFSPHPS